MHRALDQLKSASASHHRGRQPVYALPRPPYTTIVKGDGKYQSIAAASILAKTFRDEYMDSIAEEWPFYDWKRNKGYPTRAHREGIQKHGTSPYHRMSYNLLGSTQLEMKFED